MAIWLFMLIPFFFSGDATQQCCFFLPAALIHHRSASRMEFPLHLILNGEEL
jgi:hypothetical protein